MSSYYQPGKCSTVSVLSPDSSEEPAESNGMDLPNLQNEERMLIF
jgi:hypothetical protein